MKKHRKFFAIATQFLPVSHERYREMCSLAAVGQLGGPQMCDLNEHIASCDSCRAFLQEVAQASVQFLPVLAEENVVPTDVATPAGMRARFLSRLAMEADGNCKPGKELEKRSSAENAKRTLSVKRKSWCFRELFPKRPRQF
jgi:hypothetical protein